MERTPQSRMTAFKVAVKDIVNGKFVKVEEEWQPSYLITPVGQRLSRIHIFGIVVNAYAPEGGEYAALTVDDGTAAVRLKAWREETGKLGEVTIGNFVDVVGRVREYNEEIYISPETVAIIDDPNFELMRKLEVVKERRKQRELRSLVLKVAGEIKDAEKLKAFLKEKHGVEEEQVDSVLSSQEGKEPQAQLAPVEATSDGKDVVLSLIKKGGKDGVEYSELLKKAALGTEGVDNAIKELINEGEIFEPKSGVFRVLA